MSPDNLELSVSQFVALLNQTLEYAYPNVTIVGELANFRVSRNRWVYFDLKDETASLKFFGSVYQLPGPLEEGMLMKVYGQPRLHNLYGFSVNVQSMMPTGEGTIKRAAELLKAKLTKEGLFDEARKRTLPYPPRRLGLITSTQSAAYADFVKILNARWHGIDVECLDVQVQGEAAPAQLVAAIDQFSSEAEPPDVLVIVRGGGSAEDLAAFNTEIVTRAIAASRVPTLVAIGHEIDLSLAELAADRRASTPSNAAELLVPDRAHEIKNLQIALRHLEEAGLRSFQLARNQLQDNAKDLDQLVNQQIRHLKTGLESQKQLINVLNPQTILKRGYAIVYSEGKAVRGSSQLRPGAIVDVKLAKGGFSAKVSQTKD